MFLHAASLAFAHPLTGEAVRVASPLPRELEQFAQRWMSEEKGFLTQMNAVTSTGRRNTSDSMVAKGVFRVEKDKTDL
jgi:hypothetical protein